MSLNFVLLQPIIALIAGILILIVPRILNYVVALPDRHRPRRPVRDAVS